MADPKTPALDLMDMPIRVWTPLTQGDVCLAKIGNSPMLFQGATPLQVRKAADEWRKQARADFLARQATATDKARIAAAKGGAQ